MFITRGEWPEAIQLEVREVTHNGRGYKITGSPKIETDPHCLVEVFVAETMHGWRDRVRSAHWRSVWSDKKRREIRALVLQQK